MTEPVFNTTERPWNPLEEIERLKDDYQDLARAYCRLKGIAPDEPISDAGHEAWMLVAYEAIREERTR